MAVRVSLPFLPIGCRWKPTKPTGKPYSSDKATFMPEICRPCLRDIFNFSTSGTSPDKNSMHFYLLHERQNHVITDRLWYSITLALESLWMSTADMNLIDLTPEQLKRAASIKEQIDGLNKQLRGILGAPATPRAVPSKNRTMSASVKKKIAATQKARWVKVRNSKPTTVSARPAAKTKRMSPAARVKLSAKLKAYWAAKKKSGKK
jgi:hypothetical protein